MARPEHQLCVLCKAEGQITKATDADHIVPFRGIHDPSRLDWRNLQPVCQSHNSRKLHEDAKRRRQRTNTDTLARGTTQGGESKR